MATTAGIVQVTPAANTWTQLAAQACTQIIFQQGELDFAYSATPGNNFFHVRSSTVVSLTVPIVANANTIWVRNSGRPISYIWSS